MNDCFVFFSSFSTSSLYIKCVIRQEAMSGSPLLRDITWKNPVLNYKVKLSARVVKTLMGECRPTTFHAHVRSDGYYTCMGMVYAKMFYGGMATPRIPLNSSTS